MSDNPEETAFYQRIIVMYIDLGTETLLKVFKYYVPGNDVAGFLASPETKSKLLTLYREKILNKAQYNTITVNSPDPEKFDITLLVQLLISLLGDKLPQPIRGWNIKPNPKDYSLGADLLRLRNRRHTLIAHTSKARLSKEDFERLWCKIEEVLLRVSKNVEPDSSVKKVLRKYKEAPLDPTINTYSEKVRAWKENIEGILQQVEDLRKAAQEFQIYFKNPPERYFRYIKLLFDGGSLVMCGIMKRELNRSNTKLESCLLEKKEALLTLVESEQLQGQLFPPSDQKEWDIWLLATVIPILFGSQISQAEKDNIAVIKGARENYAESALSSLSTDHYLSIWTDLTISLNTLSQEVDRETAREVAIMIQEHKKRGQNTDIDAYLDRLRVNGVVVKSLEDIYKERLNELSKRLGEMNEEGITQKTQKKPNVFELKLEIVCGDEEKKHAAEETLEKVCQVKNAGSETPTQDTLIRQETEKFISNIKNIPGVEIGKVTRKCILLDIRCSSSYGSHKFISYVLSKQFQTCLQNIRNELCHTYTEPMDVLGNLTFESIYEVLNDPCSPRDIESVSGINIPITCSTAEGVQQVLALLSDEDTINSLNQIADQLSQKVDKTLSLKAFPLLNAFESVLGETDSENSGSGSGYLSNEEEAEDRSASLERKSEDTDDVSKTGTSSETDQGKVDQSLEQNTKLQDKPGQLQNTIDRQNNEIEAGKAESQRLNTILDKDSVKRKGRSVGEDFSTAEKRIRLTDLKDFELMPRPLDVGPSRVYSTLHPSVTDIINPVPGLFVSKQKYNIKMAGERSCHIYGLCQLQTGEILLADWNNKRLKKLDAGYRVIDVCDVPAGPWDVCYIGNNEAVVALGFTLQFVDVTGMTLTRSVSTEHACFGLTCHGDQLYVTDRNNVYMYSTRGIKQRLLYTHIDDLMFSIVMSDDGSKMYIACRRGLITIDSSGNLLSIFSDPELDVAVDVCVDGEGHVLVSYLLGRILQISSDGKHKLGTITNISEDKVFPRAIYFDRHKSVLTCAGGSDNVVVLQLK